MPHQTNEFPFNTHKDGISCSYGLMYEQLRFRTTDFDIDIDSHLTNKRSHTRLYPQKVLSERSRGSNSLEQKW